MKKLLIAATVVILSACATSNPDVVQYRDAQHMSIIQDATILSVRPVTVDGSQSGVGVVAGGMVGSVAGGGVGGNWRDRQAGGVIGMIAGALIGNAIERNATRQEAYEILVQLRNGERRSVIQGRGEESLNPGDAVILTTTGNKTRVSRAPMVVAPAKS
jgi:outer membrane lipoprotein SlyB